MGPSRILHVITGLDTGGAEMMLLRLVSAADRARWKHAVVSLGDHGSIGPRMEAVGVAVSAIGIRGFVPSPTALWRLRREVRRFAPALIQGWMYHGNVAALVGRGLGHRKVPIMWSVRYSPDRLSLEKRSTAAVVRMGAFLSPRATRIVYNSHTGALRHAELGYATSRAAVIPNGFDTEFFTPSPEARAEWRRRLGVGPATLLIGRIGRYHVMKDHATFLEAAALLVRERPEIRFVLAGKDVDEQNQDLSAAVTRLGLAGRVHMLGEVLPVNGLTASLDIACSSSAFGEGFPNVLGEAMACGVPCVATDVGDSARILGAQALVVPTRNPGALAAVCRRLLEAGEAERTRLGAEGRARVVREFSLPRIVESYEALYTEILS